jgi:hypothetical protein
VSHKIGAPYGNQNARKHGYYSEVRTEGEKQALSRSAAVRGVDDEIALLRVKLRSVVEQDPHNLALISHAVVSIARLVNARNRLVDGLSSISSILP